MADHRLRDLWLSEMWRPVPEWHSTRDERACARKRNEALNQRGDESTACGKNGGQTVRGAGEECA